jgi:hypothetical protein
MTDHHNDQRRLFPGVDRTILPGDWLSINHEGKTVVGMIYRCEDEAFRFAYWDNRILRFGMATRDQIGPWDEELTNQFRGQIAVMPHYIEQCITEWMMHPDERSKARLEAARRGPTGREPPKVQRRLFPE